MNLTAPPPDSWAAKTDSLVAVWTVKMAPGASWELPGTLTDDCHRSLYFFAGASVEVDGKTIRDHCAIELRSTVTVELVNGPQTSEFLILQGKPINEPIAQRGSFVMNKQVEFVKAMDDYQRTGFGGWPWPTTAPIHGRDPARRVQVLDTEPQFPIKPKR
jgi:hypothetical protein